MQKMKWKTGNERPHRLCVDRSASTVFCLIVVVLLGKPCLNPKQKRLERMYFSELWSGQLPSGSPQNSFL